MSTATQPHTHGYITAKVDDLRGIVRQYRANEVALRRLHTVWTTRNHGANASAIANRQHDRFLVEASVAFGSERAKQLVGCLVSERELLARLSWAREAGQSRPGLQTRLRLVRAEIRGLLVGRNS